MRKFLSSIWAVIVQVFTDAAGRPEVKVMLGVPLVVVAVVDLLDRGDLARFGALSGLALTLLGVTSLADAAYDKAKLLTGDKAVDPPVGK